MTTDTNQTLRNPLQQLLTLDDHEKAARGLLYTPREIWQQPETWPGTFERIHRQRAGLQKFLSESLAPPVTVYLIGAGTSDYVGRALTSVLRQAWHCDVIAVPSTELVTNIENYVLPERRYLWISFSRSGDSSEGVGAIQMALAHHPQVQHLVIACNKDGEMLRLCEGRRNAHVLLLDDPVNDRGLAMTSSFTNMVLAGQCIAHLSELEDFQPTVDQLSHMARHMLTTGAPIAERLSNLGCRKACFVGSGALAAAATEAALKCLELTAGSIAAMSESTMGLRHGPMSALDKDSIYVQSISADPRRQRYERDLLREVHAKGLGRARVAIAAQPDEQLRTWCDYLIVLGAPPDLPDDFRCIVDVIFGQMLGMFSSIHAGLKPDAPSPSGTISRVVSHVRIYL